MIALGAVSVLAAPTPTGTDDGTLPVPPSDPDQKAKSSASKFSSGSKEVIVLGPGEHPALIPSGMRTPPRTPPPSRVP
jgi:hypothetical protein